MSVTTTGAAHRAPAKMIRVRTAVLLAVAGIVVGGVVPAASGAPAAGPPRGGPSTPPAIEPPPGNATDAAAPAIASADFSREPFVIERLETTLRFESDGSSTRSVRTRVLVQSEGGVQEFGQVATGYASGQETLSVTGRVIKPDGAVTEIPESAAQDLSSQVSRFAPVYSDLREKHLVVPGLRPGDILEYEWLFAGLAPLSPGQFWAAHDFNRAAVVRDERLTIDVPAGKYVNVKSKTGLDPVVREVDGRRIYSWRSSHLERAIRDPRKPIVRLPDEPAPPEIQVSTFKTWAEVGDWYAGLESDRRVPDAAVRARAVALTGDRADEIGRLKALYDHVAQKYRYVGIMFGIGRYQPHAASEILKNQYGDCKDKHTLLAAMADAAGSRVQAALTSTSGPVDAAFPSPSQFDHVITYVPRGTGAIWLDTTAMLAPFGMLSPAIRGKQALVVAGAGKSTLERIPEEPATPNVGIRSIDGGVDESGTLEADVRVSLRGDAELFFRVGLREVPEAKWPEFVQFLTPGVTPQDEVTAVTTSDIADTDHPFEYRFHLVRRNHFNRFESDPRLALPLSDLDVSEDDEAATGDPIKLGTRQFEYHARLKLPAAFTARSPLPVEVKRDYAEYHSAYGLDQSVLSADRVLKITTMKIPPARANDYAAFWRALSSDLEQSVPVKIAAGSKPGGAGGKADDLEQAARAASASGNFRAAAGLMEEAVKADPSRDSAYTELGRAYLGMGKMDDAERALGKAVELNPYTPGAYNLLGTVYSGTRRRDQAIDAFRKQIEINPLDEWAHYFLGHQLLEQKKYREAETELAKASTISPNQSLIPVDLGKAQMELGKTTAAREAFARAVELSPVPMVWNDIASSMADHSIGLDQAEEYASTAAATVAAQSMALHLQGLRTQDLFLMGLLGDTWNTLGWVHFKRGDNVAGERYLKAAWDLTQEGAVAHRLAQLYEKTGKRDQAIEYYALAAAAPRAEPAGRTRLKELVGDIKAHMTIENKRAGLQELRSLVVPGATGDGTAEFFVMLKPSASVEEVRFISGDAALKPLAAALKRTTFGLRMPDAHDLRVVRRGFLVCSKSYSGPHSIGTPFGKSGTPSPGAPAPGGQCDFILMLPQDVRSVD